MLKAYEVNPIQVIYSVSFHWLALSVYIWVFHFLFFDFPYGWVGLFTYFLLIYRLPQKYGWWWTYQVEAQVWMPLLFSFTSWSISTIWFSSHFLINFTNEKNRSVVTLALTVLTSSQAILIVWSKRAGKYEYSVTTANFLVSGWYILLG